MRRALAKGHTIKLFISLLLKVRIVEGVTKHNERRPRKGVWGKPAELVFTKGAQKVTLKLRIIVGVTKVMLN